jgi:hypothetical protein
MNIEVLLPKRRHNITYEHGKVCSETSAQNHMRTWNSVPKRRHKFTREHGTGCSESSAQNHIWTWNSVFRNVGTKLPMNMEQTVFRNVGT